jgi:hypothetical protein
MNFITPRYKECLLSLRRLSFFKLVLAAGLLTVPFIACAAETVDSRLIGTWQLRGSPTPMTWEIHANGTYELTANGSLVHAGSFQASNGQWRLKSPVWEDGGSYELPDKNTFVGTGKLGPATWIRAVRAAPQAQRTPSKEAVLSIGGGLPKDVPEMMKAALKRAQNWQKDALPVAVEFEEVDAPNPAAWGPQVIFYFVSASSGKGFRVTVAATRTSDFVFNQTVNWAAEPLPPVFVDLPAAFRIAREHGMKGAPRSASMRVYTVRGNPPILAWIVHPGNGEGKTINAATGEIIDFDVTGYIAQYNAQWQRAAKGLRALLRSGHPRGEHSPSIFTEGGSSSSEGGGQDTYTDEDYRREVAEDAAYWNGSSEDYNRIKNGECTWSDNSNYGC